MSKEQDYKDNPKPNEKVLVSFRDGSYKKVEFVDYKHSQWIHLKRPNGKSVRVNPLNVNYIEEI